MWENFDYLKKRKQKIKTRTGNSTRNADKKIYESRPKLSNKGKTREYVQTEKWQQEKNDDTTWGNKVLVKDGRLNIYQQRENNTEKIGDSKKRKIILATRGRRWHENMPTTGCKRNRPILDDNMTTKRHNDKAERINNITKELDGLDEDTKTEIHIYLLKTTLKNIKLENWKFTSIHDRLTLETNSFLQGAHVPKWLINGKTTPIE